MNDQTLGLLDEVKFPDLQKAIEAMLNCALHFVTDVASFFQISLINRERIPYQGQDSEFMTIRWYAIRGNWKPTQRIKPYLKGQPIVKDKGETLLWDVVECELGKPFPSWLHPKSVSKLFEGISSPPPYVKRIYLADLAKEEVQKKAIKVVKDWPLKSSVLIPLWITPMRLQTAVSRQKDRLVGVLSVDPGIPWKDVWEDKKDELRLICALASLVGRTVEALDLAFYDFLLGSYGVLSNAFYFKYIDSLQPKEQKKLALAFFDLNNFKQVNDEHGHEEGNEVLSKFSKEVVQMCSTTSFLHKKSWMCRFGGDEFMLLAQVKNIKKFQQWLCENMMKEWALCSCSHHPVSPSIGVATWKKAAEHEKPDLPSFTFTVANKMRALADKAMYASKQIYKELKGEKKWAVILYDISEKEIKALDKQNELKSLVEKNFKGVKDRK